MVKRSLEARGYAVELCASGAEGLARLARGGVDAVALDHHMPGQTGLDLLPEIRSLPQAPPVIYVTGSEDSRVAVAALKAGAVDYVWKDIQGQFRELLGEAVATALRQEALRRDKERAEAEMREARDRAELLLREVNHRVANSLALVAALAHMQRNAVTDPAAKAALDEMQARISAIAGIHRRLYTSRTSSRWSWTPIWRVLSRNAGGDAGERARSRDPSASGAGAALARQSGLGRRRRDRTRDQRLQVRLPTGQLGEIRVAVDRDAADTVSLAVEDDGIGWTGEGEIQGTGSARVSCAPWRRTCARRCPIFPDRPAPAPYWSSSLTGGLSAPAAWPCAPAHRASAVARRLRAHETPAPAP